MKNKKKIEEPFDPQNTPEPAQVMDPNKRKEEQDKRNSPANTAGQSQQPQKQKDEAKPKLLGESETEIDDETTI
jgi:hypothetical protein